MMNESGNNNDGQVAPQTMQDFERWLSDYVGQTEKLALLLDYDGTLSPLVSHPDLAVMPEDTRKSLEHLCSMPDVYVAIISGRGLQNVKDMVGIDGITYAGNHGFDIMSPNGSMFIHPDQAKYASTMNELKDEIEKEVCVDGAWLEFKGFSMTYHYRSVAMDTQAPLIDKVTALILKYGFHLNQAHCAIEARPPITWNKGLASIHILQSTFGDDWSKQVRVIFVGDDTTDEDAMQSLKGNAVTFRVTNSQTLKTAASHRLKDTHSVTTLLKWVEQHMEKRTKNSPKPSPNSK